MTVRGLIQRPWQVEAFLAGRRTQVRVRLKSDTIEGTWPTEEWGPWEECEPGYWIGCNNEGTTIFARCPLGAVGDVLAIREAWTRVEPHPSINEPYEMPECDPREYLGGLDYWQRRIAYRADFGEGAEPPSHSDGRWRAPATMPLWAARLRYRVLDVRAEQVREAPRAESFGYPDWRLEGVRCPAHSLPCMCAHEWRKQQWEADHGPGSWETDWCFAATVERIQEAAP